MNLTPLRPGQWASLATAFSLLLPITAFAQNIAIAVDATKTVRTVDERVFGANSVMWDSQAPTDQTISLVQAAGIRTIRIPGG